MYPLYDNVANAGSSKYFAQDPISTFDTSTGKYTGEYWKPYASGSSQLNSFNSAYPYYLTYSSIANTEAWSTQPVVHATSLSYNASYVYIYYDYIYYRKPKKISSSYVMYNTSSSTTTAPDINVMFPIQKDSDGYFYTTSGGDDPIVHKEYLKATIDGVSTICYFVYDGYNY